MPGYHGGHILRIKVINFMTYDELEIFPKSGLNLIVGLNGSGKSSIMCAICLGLAGKPQSTGRSTQLSDFVKFGCSEAKIEIELENTSKKNVVISRTIQGDKSIWHLNNKLVSLNEIDNTIRKFNIDVGNLCQFLPQEKVMEFSKMDKKQRLENMLKAVGDEALFSTFEELKQIRENSLKIEEHIKRLKNEKDCEEQEMTRLKSEVDKHEKKLRLKETLKTLQYHKMYLTYYEIKTKHKLLRNEKTSLANKILNLNEKLKKIDERSNIKTNNLNEVIKLMKTLNEEIVSLQDFIGIEKTAMSELRKKGRDAEIHYKNMILEKRTQVEKLTEISNQIQVLRNLCYENESQSPLLKERDKELSQNLDRIKSKMPSLISAKFSLSNEKNHLDQCIKGNTKEVEKLKVEENKKMELLKQRFKDVYEGVIWLEKNKDKFRASVHPPMFLTLKVNKEEDCKYIENLVAHRDLLAFICEDKEDSKLLTSILRIEKNLNVNIVMVPVNPIEHYRSPDLTPELKKLGVICFLKDVIEAPNTIKRFLYHCYNLHSVPLCSNFAEQNMKELFLHDSRISLFFTPDAKITGKRSKYGDRNFCFRRDQLKLFNFLSCSKDISQQLHLLQTQLQVENDKLKLVTEKLKTKLAEINDLELEEKSLKEEKKEVYRKLKVYSNAEEQLNQKLALCERKEFELINEEEEKSKLTDVIQNINKRKMTIFLTMAETIEKFLSMKKPMLLCNLRARIIQKALTSFQQEQSELAKEIEDANKKFEDLSSEIKKIKKEAMDLRKDTSPWIDSYKEEKKNCSFDFFGIENKEEIVKEIYRAEALLNLNSDDNEVGTADYEEKEEKIAKIMKQIDTYEQELKNFQAEITQKKSPWLPQLQNHIQNINVKFGAYYKQLNYSGEVVLDTCNDTDDFPNYGLQITLKYRDNEPLSELSNTRHSGGECSVAAIIFILSLQGFTDIPFRCIDEINQGMDSQNERNIYDLIAQSAQSESCLQYFLLTPKLLMDLEMIKQKNVVVHVIYNSCFLEVKINVAEYSKLPKKRKRKLL